MKYVIEHMEDAVSDWVTCEYKRIVSDVGAENVIFTNMRPGENCPDLESQEMRDVLQGAVAVSENFLEFFAAEKGGGDDLSRVCLLDQEATELLVPEDEGKFEYFLFGGILGNVDDFDADRTKVLRAQGYTCRNLREAQMTTPTAVCVSHRILHRKVPFDELRFVDRPEFETDGAETLMMPFRYLADSSTGKPIMADGILDLLTSDLEWDISDLQ
eukprot:g1489.t1